jgi:hypothetical protein
VVADFDALVVAESCASEGLLAMIAAHSPPLHVALVSEAVGTPQPGWLGQRVKDFFELSWPPTPNSVVEDVLPALATEQLPNYHGLLQLLSWAQLVTARQDNVTEVPIAGWQTEGAPSADCAGCLFSRLCAPCA